MGPGVVTSPTMSGEHYTVTCDFTAEASDQVALREGDVVSVLFKRELGWWLVATEDGAQGWAPATHLQSDLKQNEDQVVRFPTGMGESKHPLLPLPPGVTCSSRDNADQGLRDPLTVFFVQSAMLCMCVLIPATRLSHRLAEPCRSFHPEKGVRSPVSVGRVA